MAVFFTRQPGSGRGACGGDTKLVSVSGARFASTSVPSRWMRIELAALKVKGLTEAKTRDDREEIAPS